MSDAPCADGCIARTLQAQLESLKHELDVARLDLNARFLPNVTADRRVTKLKPTTERRK